MIERLKARIDELQRRNAVLGFVIGVVKKNGDDRGGQLAALITYYGFFSLFPLLLVAFTILGFVLQGDADLQADVADTLQERLPLPGISADSLNGSGVALVVGLLLALWAGLGATQAAQDAMNTVWDVPRHDAPNFFRKRLRGLLILGVLGLGLVVATAASSLASIFGPGAGIAGALGSLAANSLLVGALIKVMPERDLALRDVRWGAVAGGVGWTALQLVGAWYTERLVNNADKTYGTFAVVIGLLSWIYLQAQVFVYAAEVASVSSRRLWPRSIDTDRPTEADGRVQAAIVERSKVPA